MEKGEIARYEQFLLFPLCSQKTCTADSKNQGLFGKGLTNLFASLTKPLKVAIRFITSHRIKKYIYH